MTGFLIVRDVPDPTSSFYQKIGINPYCASDLKNALLLEDGKCRWIQSHLTEKASVCLYESHCQADIEKLVTKSRFEVSAILKVNTFLSANERKKDRFLKRLYPFTRIFL